MDARRRPAPILVGTCNWLDHEEFYPDELRGRRQPERLSFYARYFPLVEIDTSFYGIPTPDRVAAWVARTPDDFLFNIKAYRSLTGHEREQGRPRPRPRRRSAPSSRRWPRSAPPGSWARCTTSSHPGWSAGTAGREAVLRARERHPGDVLAVEFRHRSWFEHGRLAETEDLLRELDCTLVGVDAPQLGSGTAPPHLAVTSPRLVLVRFHGRNYQTWYRRTATTGERFDYLYQPSELAQWVPAIQAAAEQGVPVHVLMNNNRSNYAVVNGFDMAHLLGVRLPRPPAPILRADGGPRRGGPRLGARCPRASRARRRRGVPEIAGRAGCGTIRAALSRRLIPRPPPGACPGAAAARASLRLRECARIDPCGMSGAQRPWLLGVAPPIL